MQAPVHKFYYTQGVSPRLSAYFREYDRYHQTPGNELCHFAGIPLIVVSLLGLLSTKVFGLEAFFGSPLLRLDGGTVFWFVATIWYIKLDWRIGLPFSFATLSGYFVGRSIPNGALGLMFVVGWVLQGVGHVVYEKKSPAFFRNLSHVLIGPLWIFAKLTGYSG